MAVRRRLPQELHGTRTRREGPLAPPARVRVVDEARLEDALLVRDQEVMDDAVAEVCGEDLPRLRALRQEADRPSRPVAAAAKLGLECEQVAFETDLEREGTARVPLVPAADAVVPPQLREGEEVRADHDPPRTART